MLLLLMHIRISNHIHVIWKVQANFQPKDIQLLLKYTAQMIIKDLRNNHQRVLAIFKVMASDRKYQVWERNALTVLLWSHSLFKQKVDYIHSSPVVAGIWRFPEEFKYSSASFYLKADSRWSF